MGLVRYRLPLLPLMACYFIMRCLLLATIENSEPRYTLEAYPIVLVCAAVVFSGYIERETNGLSDCRP